MNAVKKTENFSKYEVARILGARALQIAMNAPLLIKIKQEDLEDIKFDALKIAEIEFKSGILPISIKKPLPKKRIRKLQREKERKMTDRQKKAIEKKEEKEIVNQGEIMELANVKEEKEEKPEEVEKVEKTPEKTSEKQIEKGEISEEQVNKAKKA